MQEVASMISLMSEHLSEQQDDIQHVLEAANQSTELIHQVRLACQ